MMRKSCTIYLSYQWLASIGCLIANKSSPVKEGSKRKERMKEWSSSHLQLQETCLSLRCRRVSVSDRSTICSCVYLFAFAHAHTCLCTVYVCVVPKMCTKKHAMENRNATINACTNTLYFPTHILRKPNKSNHT